MKRSICQYLLSILLPLLWTAAAAEDGTHSAAPPPQLQRAEDSLAFARETLAFVERTAPRPELAAALEALAAQVAARPQPEGVRQQILDLRRQIIFSHPSLNFDRLLINKRPTPGYKHQTDQYLGRHSGPGDGLVILENWKTTPQETPLLKDRLPIGSTLHPDLSFDGKKILFSWCDHTVTDPIARRFFIYEIGIDGSGLRQLTGTADDPLAGRHDRVTSLIEDFDPCYLPAGGFAFVSSRNQGAVRCHHGGRYCPTYLLYRAEADGSGIRPLAYGEANEWDPSILPDGRIIWTRWDYINRHDTWYQSLWTIGTDGTATAHFYGNYTRNPCMIAEARAIPGSSKVIATATAHHMYTAGSIIMIDPSQGEDGGAPLTRLTPEVSFPETEKDPATGKNYPTAGFATPWPLSEDLFLAAYTDSYGEAPPNHYGIYLVDSLGGRELIYRVPGTSCFSPIPVQPREKPPAVPELAASTSKTGSFFVQNVYEGRQKIEPGTITDLRVVRLYPQTLQRVPDRSATIFETVKGIVGTVPVAADGSVAFEAPAQEPLLFQLLDRNGMAVMSMRSFTYLQPGEQQSCVGCHENRGASPKGYGRTIASRPQPLTPPQGPAYSGGLAFARTVQPVLDRTCITCHGLEKTAGNLNLLGTMDMSPIKLGTIRASAAYNALTNRKRNLVAMAYRNEETVASKPGDYFSPASRLAQIIVNGDANHAALTGSDLRRMLQWMDLNCQFYGDYAWQKREWHVPPPPAVQALREAIAAAFTPAIADQPLAALINVSQPEESRILLAPLAESAGGWGQMQGWQSKEDPGYKAMQALVIACIPSEPLNNDSQVCGLTPCQCGVCWVPIIEAAYRAGHPKSGSGR